MDADRLTALLRAWRNAPTRRDVTRALGGTMLAAPLATLLGTVSSDAKKRKKKKKKKCKKSQIKCGKKCIPATSCCTSCGENGTCVNGTCTCFAEFRPCKGTCIPDGECCDDDECPGGGICANGECRCLDGFKLCDDECILDDDCCVDDDCGDACTTCQSGTCTGGCGAGETCLANGSCGTTCANNGGCTDNVCACAAEEGDDPVCRVTGTPQSCSAASPCTTTADCDPGSVCTSVCPGPSNLCLALCNA